MKRKYFYQCFITTLKPENQKLVAEHLRHWPFVKMYFYLNDKAIAVVTNLGKSAEYKGSLSMFEVSRVIIGQCLKQYDVEVSCWNRVELSRISYKTRHLFASRPRHHPLVALHQGIGLLTLKKHDYGKKDF